MVRMRTDPLLQRIHWGPSIVHVAFVSKHDNAHPTPCEKKK